MKYRITKIEQLGKFQSEKIGVQFYFLVHLRVYPNPEQNAFYRVKFISWFDGEDILKYIGADSWNKEDFNDCKYDFISNHAESLCSSNNIQEIFAEADETIKRYNA